MAKRVITYEAQDGTTHESAEAADKHDRACELVEVIRPAAAVGAQDDELFAIADAIMAKYRISQKPQKAVKKGKKSPTPSSEPAEAAE